MPPLRHTWRTLRARTPAVPVLDRPPGETTASSHSRRLLDSVSGTQYVSSLSTNFFQPIIEISFREAQNIRFHYRNTFILKLEVQSRLAGRVAFLFRRPFFARLRLLALCCGPVLRSLASPAAARRLWKNMVVNEIRIMAAVNKGSFPSRPLQNKGGRVYGEPAPRGKERKRNRGNCCSR